MTIPEKIQFIQRFSGLTQAGLANRLGVTFAALNRWFNGKAVPRNKMQEKIDELYREYSGKKEIPESVRDAKKGIIFKKSRSHKNVVKEILNNPDILDEFLLSLTYHSNRIEGSTLTENETAAIIFQNAALPNKSLVEQLEAKNHETALRYLFDYVAAKKPVNEELVLKLHGILMNAIRPDAGSYRNHPVRIAGAYVPTANYLKVPQLMKKLIQDIDTNDPDIVLNAALIHSRFEQIHPFSDGNGRVGRILMHAMLLHGNLPPAIIRQEKRRLYNLYLNIAQLKDDLSGFDDFVADAVLEGFKVLERKKR